MLTAASTAGYGREDFSAVAKVVLAPGRSRMTPPPRPAPEPLVAARGPSLILAADHRARGVMTIERYDAYLAALTEALPHCDGILASTQPLVDLAASGAVGPRHRTYLSLNRTGLAGSAFELDDRLVTSVWRARRATAGRGSST